MSLNRIIAIFGIVLVIFAGIVFYQFNKSTGTKSSRSDSLTPSSKVVINNHTFHVTVAKTSEEQQRGLSGLNSLPSDQGMLFLFDKPDYYSFWMKNMKFPIDIIFIKDDKVVSIVENAKPQSDTNPPIYQPEAPINRVLEINAGLSKKYNIKKGDRVEIDL